MGSQSSKLSPEVLSDLHLNTKFSKAEIHKWYRNFIKECPSGQLNEEEFKQMYIDFFSPGDELRFSKHVFRTFDTNGDGRVDFREFLWSISITSHGTVEQKLTWAFTMYDLDGDGYITREEMLEIVSCMYKMGCTRIHACINEFGAEITPETHVEKIFRQMDKNMDGKLSLEEFIEGTKLDPAFLGILKRDEKISTEYPVIVQQIT